MNLLLLLILSSTLFSQIGGYNSARELQYGGDYGSSGDDGTSTTYVQDEPTSYSAETPTSYSAETPTSYGSSSTGEDKITIPSLDTIAKHVNKIKGIVKNVKTITNDVKKIANKKPAPKKIVRKPAPKKLLKKPTKKLASKKPTKKPTKKSIKKPTRHLRSLP